MCTFGFVKQWILTYLDRSGSLVLCATFSGVGFHFVETTNVYLVLPNVHKLTLDTPVNMLSISIEFVAYIK